MKKRTITTILPALFLTALLCCGFVKAPQHATAKSRHNNKSNNTDSRTDIPFRSEPPHDSLALLYACTDAILSQEVEGDRLAALLTLSEAIAADSTYAPAWYRLSKLMLESDPDLAIEPARRAAQLDTTNKWYLENYVTALLSAGHYSEALPESERLVERFREANYYHMLALLYQYNEQPYEAIAVLDSAEVQAGIQPAITRLKRELLLETKQYDRALAEALRDVEARPYETENYIALGEIYQRRGEDSLAYAALVRAAETDASDFWTRYALASYYLQKEDIDGYLNELQGIFGDTSVPVEPKVLVFRRLCSEDELYMDHFSQMGELSKTLYTLYPDSPDAAIYYSIHLFLANDIEGSAQICREMLENPENRHPDLYIRTSDMEMLAGRPESAENYMQTALELFPGELKVYVSYAILAATFKETEKALRLTRQALDYAEDDATRSILYGYIGDMLYRQYEEERSGRLLKECYKAYDKALKYDGDNAAALNNYAYYISLEKGTKSLDKALAMSVKAVGLEKENPTYIDTYAWVLYRLGRYAEAQDAIKRAIALDRTGSPDLRMHYGDILDALGEAYMARIYWQRALDAGYDPEAVQQRIKNQQNR